jgi:hypothetical protein
MACFSFGASRSAYDKLYQKHSKINTDRNIPGPGTYSVPSIFSKNGDNSYSLKGRGKSMQDLMINKKRELPGPGQYSPKTSISKDGIYKISGMRNTATITFKPSERFKTIRGSLPGPGQYSLPSSINSNGRYFISKFKN